MSLPLPLCSFSFLSFNVILLCALFFPIPTHETALVAPVSKDKSTNLFTLSVYMKTPLRPTQLYLDLGFLFSWVPCDSNYNSSSFHHITCDASFCESLGFGALSCGLVSLGRSKLSLQAQISASLSTPNSLALCFPSSPKDTGIAFFASHGPYYALSSSNTNSKIDLSKSLIYTPLILNPVATGDTEINFQEGTPSNEYFIGLTSIQINGYRVPINESLLSINQESGFGGTKISTATPYTRFESSIHKSFTELFVKEAASSSFNLTVTTPVKPFNVCYPAGDLTITPLGPSVPTVDLVLHARDVVWRILGANSMARVKNKKKGVDLWCLGFVDGGVDVKTPIVIGGKQLEDNLLQFDIESNRFGFTSSLLSRSLSCGHFNITNK